MQEIHSIFQQLLFGTELLAAVVGAFYLKKLKHSYWRWFSIYLIVIFLQELFWGKISELDRYYHLLYHIVFGVSIQYIFFYWLYAYKSLKKRRVFTWMSTILISATAVLLFIAKPEEALKFTTNLGGIFLIVLLIFEMVKQIKNDEILKLKENKMFYINMGMVLFYIGSLPFQALSKELYEGYRTVYDVYYLYFLVSNCIMYLLFAISFIWGKTHSS